MPEGELTKFRASIVCEPTLAMCAKEIGLDEMLYLGKGEELTGGRFRDSIISDAFEALIGAIYKDGGIECATGFVEKFVLQDIDNKKLFVDSKSILQERIQAGYKSGPEYVLVGENGPDHCKEFFVEVRIEGKTIGTGSGRTKKAAEQKAAYNAIINMQKQNTITG
jgi:ribonuclease-3